MALSIISLNQMTSMEGHAAGEADYQYHGANDLGQIHY